MDLLICKIKLDHLVRTSAPLTHRWILLHGIRLLRHLFGILHRLQHLQRSRCTVDLILVLWITAHGILLLCQKVVVRDDGLPKRDALIIVLRVDHLSFDRVLDGLLELVLVQFLEGVHSRSLVACLSRAIYC